MQNETAWLKDTSWETVISINKSLCEEQKLELLKGQQHDQAKVIWEKARAQNLTLLEAIEVCRRCNDLVPFTFNSGNTFAKICHRLVQGWADQMPSVEAHLLRTTVSHYVNGQVCVAELKSILKMAEKRCQDPKPARAKVPPVLSSSPAPSPKQQGQPA